MIVHVSSPVTTRDTPRLLLTSYFSLKTQSCMILRVVLLFFEGMLLLVLDNVIASFWKICSCLPMRLSLLFEVDLFLLVIENVITF